MLAIWPKKKRPPISLSAAQTMAERALGKEARNFYPLWAAMQISTPAGGDWTFIFGSTSGEQRWVIVDIAGHVTVRNQPPIVK